MKTYYAPELFSHRSLEGYNLRWGCAANNEVALPLNGCRSVERIAMLISDAAFKISMGKKLKKNKTE